MALLHTKLRDHLPLLATGKVRELYALDEHRLLFVTTDRISGTMGPVTSFPSSQAETPASFSAALVKLTLE